MDLFQNSRESQSKKSTQQKRGMLFYRGKWGVERAVINKKLTRVN